MGDSFHSYLFLYRFVIHLPSFVRPTVRLYYTFYLEIGYLKSLLVDFSRTRSYRFYITLMNYYTQSTIFISLEHDKV